MHLLLLALSACGLMPMAARFPEDSGSPWVVPGEYSDPDFVQVASFNAEWLWSATEDGYAPRNEVDYGMVARLFSDFDLELVGLQEVNGGGAMELLQLPPEFDWVLGSTGWSQNLGILWRADRLVVENAREIQLPVNEFPSKDPLVAEVSSLDGELAFTFVVVHNKPYSDSDNAQLRYEQVQQLHQWLHDELAQEQDNAPFHEQVVIAGDFNDTFEALNSSWPSLRIFEDDPEYSFISAAMDDYTQITWRSRIDHIIISDDLLPAWPQRDQTVGCQVIAHDQLDPWSSYEGGFDGEQNISDHRPLWAYLSANP